MLQIGTIVPIKRKDFIIDIKELIEADMHNYLTSTLVILTKLFIKDLASGKSVYPLKTNLKLKF